MNARSIVRELVQSVIGEAKTTLVPGARALVDGRDEVKIRQAFPNGSSSFLFPHYKVDYIGGDKNIAVPWGQVSVRRK
jgi:hypothetical protein